MRSRFCSIVNPADIHVSLEPFWPELWHGDHDASSITDETLSWWAVCTQPHLISFHFLKMFQDIHWNKFPRRDYMFYRSKNAFPILWTTWSCAPCKQFGVLDQWHDGHTVVGYAVDTTSAVAKVEANTNQISLTLWVYKFFTEKESIKI